MNNRIKELAKQAEALVESMPIEERWDWLNLYDQKFAELIVRECAEAGGQAVDRAEQYGIRSVSDYVYLKIKEHFGVERD